MRSPSGSVVAKLNFTMNPSELKSRISSGLLSFPVTDFTSTGDFDPSGYAARLEWLTPYGATALFAAGGTGEFFSLELGEYSQVIKTATDACKGKVPIIAGAGGPTRTAAAFAREAEQQNADGILLLPHYLTQAPQAGLAAHVKAVCAATQLGVIVYNRGVCRLNADTLASLADECPNLIGFKDGIGEIELMVTIRQKLGDRLSYLGGLPTAEVYAAPYRALGVPVYSSAVFNFIPKTAMDFYRAVSENDTQTQARLFDQFFFPLVALRNRCAGYAVSMIKAGARLVGKDPGPVRPPLVDLTPDEEQMLKGLIDSVGPQ